MPSNKLRRKSSLMKVLSQDAAEDRKINKFVAPFQINSTPYYKVDFSESTKRVCEDRNSKSSIASNLKICKIIVLGDVSVGKTSIVNRFCRKIFDSSYKPTIGVDFEVERYDVLGVPFNLQIWDTAGQERFKCIAQSYYRNSHVIILVFDLTNLLSLSHCKTWLMEAFNACGSMLPYVFMVGSKKDLLGSYAYKNAEINAIKMAKSLNAEYWPVSSKTGENIDEFFSRIAALTFDDSVKNELAASPIKPIGSDLITFKKRKTVSLSNFKSNRCQGSGCQK